MLFKKKKKLWPALEMRSPSKFLFFLYMLHFLLKKQKILEWISDVTKGN